VLASNDGTSSYNFNTQVCVCVCVYILRAHITAFVTHLRTAARNVFHVHSFSWRV